MNYAKIAYAAAGFGLVAMTTFVPVQADGLKLASPDPSGAHSNGPSLSSHVVAIVEPRREFPLGLLIKTPETPHGVSFNRQIARVEVTPMRAHG